MISRNPTDNFYARNYSKSHFDKFDYSANIKLTRDLDIELLVNRTFTESFNQQLDVINGNLDETPRNGVGNFSISQIMIGASFKNEKDVFQTFKDNRAIISQRLSDDTGGNIDGFGGTSQDVVLQHSWLPIRVKMPTRYNYLLSKKRPCPIGEFPIKVLWLFLG